MNEDWKESNQTHCYTGKFNVALSLCRVLGVTLYFSKGFLEAAARVLAVTKVLPLRETIVYFLGVGDGDDLEKEFLANETTRDKFVLFWEVIARLEVEVFPCFWE